MLAPLDPKTKKPVPQAKREEFVKNEKRADGGIGGDIGRPLKPATGVLRAVTPSKGK